MLNQSFSLRDLQYSTAELAQAAPRHRWYVIKEAFASKMVESALDVAEVNDGELLLDPFCGSGTVPLAAAARDARAIGIEVNPFLAFVSRTKLLNCRPRTLKSHAESVMDMAEKGRTSPLETFSTFSEACGKPKWLFNTNVLRAFEGGWAQTKVTAQPTRDLIRLALIGAAMDNCNAEADGKCLRYHKGWQSRKFTASSFVESFNKRIEVMAIDVEAMPVLGNRAEVVLGDSRRALGNIENASFKLCITSPPYLNSFDYTDVYRPELFLSKFVGSAESLRALRYQTLRSHVQVAWERPHKRSFGPIFDDTMDRLEKSEVKLWNQNIPDMVRAYFEDVEKILLHLRRLASKKAALWVVVSTSAYAGVEIPVDLIYAEVGQRTGWDLSEVGVLRHLRSSGQHTNNTAIDGTPPSRLRESVVIMTARGRR